jgi:uncharacterized membrane protein
MASPNVILTVGDGTKESVLYRLRQALKRFMAIPLLIMLIVTAFSVGLYTLDRHTPTWLRPLRAAIKRHLFANSDTTGAFLGTVAGGMFTQTSIVVSMLLLVLQQTASNMGNAIYVQFLRRHRNQVFAGYVVGALMMALVLRSMVSDQFNPVLGATVVMLAMVLTMALLVWFLYSTIQQMRPEMIIKAIHDQTQKAYETHRTFIERFRPVSLSNDLTQVTLQMNNHGFLAELDIEQIGTCVQDHNRDVEIVFHAHIGDYLAYHDTVLEIKAETETGTSALARCLGDALHIADQRVMQQDPNYGLKQLEMIGWTETSTARNNPEVGVFVTEALKNLMATWLWEEGDESAGAEPLPVVYTSEPIENILDVWESLFTVSSESMQHQTFAELLRSLRCSYPLLSPKYQERADQVLYRATSAMGDHVLTRDIDDELTTLIDRLEELERHRVASILTEARRELAASWGKLANRSTRTKQAT